MVTLHLKRVYMGPDCTKGVICVNGDPLYVTIERPWKNNQRGISCIPPGRYTVKWVDTQTSGNVNGRGLGLTNVQDRDLIRIHAANKPSQVEGCIAPGTRWTVIDGEKAVSESKYALAKLQALIKDDGTDEAALFVSNY